MKDEKLSPRAAVEQWEEKHDAQAVLGTRLEEDEGDSFAPNMLTPGLPFYIPSPSEANRAEEEARKHREKLKEKKMRRSSVIGVEHSEHKNAWTDADRHVQRERSRRVSEIVRQAIYRLYLDLRTFISIANLSTRKSPIGKGKNTQ